MQLQQLRAFCEVAREQSFTRAARNLHYAQSSVTAQIQNLEVAVGVPLFHRGGRHVTLTEGGHCLLPYAERIIEVAEEARRQVTEVHEVPGRGTPRPYPTPSRAA